MTKKAAQSIFRYLTFSLGAGVLSWKAIDIVKGSLLAGAYDGINSWVLPFYHPFQGGLINYISLALCMGVLGVSFYVFGRDLDAGRGEDRSESSWGPREISFSLLLALPIIIRPRSEYAAVCAVLLVLIPLSDILSERFFRKVIPGLIAVFFAIMCYEPIALFKGPVSLMNEYAELYGKTNVGDGFVNNRDFLERLPPDRAAKLVAAYKQKTKLENSGLEAEDGWLMTPISRLNPGELGLLDRLSGEKVGEAASIAHFYRANYLEYSHQAMTRGQINHIGHILNPLNEYEAGKPSQEVYWQYGIGNARLMNFVMGAFGGISLHNYYKNYLFYPLYFLIFLSLGLYLFKDGVYAGIAFFSLGISYFCNGYVPFLLAPGILPTIHFFDVLVMAALVFALRRNGGWRGFSAAFMFAGMGVYLNFQFGMMCLLSLVVALTVFLAENREGLRKYLSLLSVFFLLIACYKLLAPGASGAESGIFGTYLSGFFSWRPQSIVVGATILWLALSYAFLAVIKDSRSVMKYALVYVFAYAQCLFVYFYWSGLINHLSAVIPFVSLQFIAVLHIIETEEFSPAWLKSAAPGLKKLSIVITLLLLSLFVYKFYHGDMGKQRFLDNFQTHATYKWDFAAARVVSTVDPEPIKEAVSLIGVYSAQDKGIHILSRYDNLLPLLAGKYSRMPFFELPWYLTSEDRVHQVVESCRRNNPRYLFVDTEINTAPEDLWGKLYRDDWMKTETYSRNLRLLELRKIFNALSADYRLVKKGRLISVYEHQ